MAHARIRKGLRGQSKPVRSQFVEGCVDCRKETKRWIVISETVMSSQVQRYHTEAAARQHYDGLANWPIVKRRTLARLVDCDGDGDEV